MARSKKRIPPTTPVGDPHFIRHLEGGRHKYPMTFADRLIAFSLNSVYSSVYETHQAEFMPRHVPIAPTQTPII